MGAVGNRGRTVRCRLRPTELDICRDLVKAADCTCMRSMRGLAKPPPLLMIMTLRLDRLKRSLTSESEISGRVVAARSLTKAETGHRIVNSWAIAHACEDHVSFIPIGGESRLHFTTIACLVSTLCSQTAPIMAALLSVCDRQGVATVDQAHQIIVDAPLHGTGAEQSCGCGCRS